ncbi:hypothetical protein Y032_0045g1178 [Ancylostoma ceylanicum]|nr:hypothetical protein Y032_0045g1178 [Ancylostoma ceylanicum]
MLILALSTLFHPNLRSFSSGTANLARMHFLQITFHRDVKAQRIHNGRVVEFSHIWCTMYVKAFDRTL